MCTCPVARRVPRHCSRGSCYSRSAFRTRASATTSWGSAGAGSRSSSMPDTPSEPAAGLSETEQQILDRLEHELGDAVVDSASAFGTLVVRVRPDAWRRAAEVSKAAL